MNSFNFIKSAVIKCLNESISNKNIYRGGLPLDRNKIKSDGISFTTNIKIAQYWAGSVVNGKLFEYKLKESANILTTNNFPEKIKPIEKPYNHQDKERIVNYALVNGYDGVDLSGYFNENEIRIFNIDIVN